MNPGFPGCPNWMFAPLFHRFRRHAGSRLALSIGLLLAVAVLEAGGLVSILPLIDLLGLGQSPMGSASGRDWRAVFQAFGVRPGLGPVLLGFGTILLMQSVLRRWAERVNAQLESGFANDLRQEVYGALVRIRWLAFTRLRAAEVTRVLTQEVDQAAQAAQQALIFFGSLALALVHGSLALACSVPLTLLALGSGVVLALILRPMNRRSHASGRHGQHLRRELTAVASEHLAGFKVAKSHGAEAAHREEFRQASEALARHLSAARRLASASRSMFEVAGWLSLLLFLWVAVTWIHVSSGTLVMMVLLFTRLLPRMGAIQSAWQQCLNLLPAFHSVESLRLELESYREAGTAVAGRLELTREIRVESVSFAYAADASRPAVDAASLSIPARRMTALVGLSGSGKSTLADLALGLLQPDAGRVWIDDQPLEGDRVFQWRNSVGYVPQEPFLFHDTVRGNLLWARPEATEEELWAALQAAAAEEFVRRLPQGWNTIVGDRGIRLSGGERQRLTLARALLRRPAFLLLDEATSSLDGENERFIQEALDRLHGQLTILVIAHRLSTVQKADRVVVLEAGRVVESGTPAELSLKVDGAFRRMMHAVPNPSTTALS